MNDCIEEKIQAMVSLQRDATSKEKKVPFATIYNQNTNNIVVNRLCGGGSDSKKSTRSQDEKANVSKTRTMTLLAVSKTKSRDLPPVLAISER